ncbi:MAG: SBBP repeat-containing protein, partial [Acidimicrobiales bacterium]
MNHFRGSDPAGWHTNIPTFAKVASSGVYPGIDLVYYGKQGGQVEYDFVVAPGADPGAIRLGLEGAEHLSLDAGGDLVAQTAVGEVRQHRPVVYQTVDGQRRPVAGSFVLGPGDQVRFSVGRYDRSLPLVIDPVITYSTWVGGGGADVGFGLAVASDGAVVIAGETTSTNFPTTGGVSCGGSVTSSFQCNKGLGDAFVTKLNAAGSALTYSTYLGGDRDDFAHEVALDASGNAYLTGGTVSYEDPATAATEATFPTTASAYDATCGTDGNCNAPQASAGSSCPQGSTCPTAGLWDAFVSKLSSDGATLSYSTYLGGANQENNAQGIAFPGYAGITASGSKAYVGGYTGSADFPTTAGAAQTTCGTSGVAGCDENNGDGFVAVIDTSQSGSSSLEYSQFLGGSGHEEVRSVALDSLGAVYVTGATYATEAGTNNFPTTAGAFQTTYQGGKADAFVVKIKHTDANPKVKYATYLGGGGFDVGWGIAVDGDKKATVTGWTNSGDDPATGGADGPTPYFPTTSGAYDTTFNGRATATGFTNLFYDGDAFVSRLGTAGDSLGWSTFIGGTDMDVATAVAVDSSANAYITGYTTCQNDNGGVPLPPGGTLPAACTGSFPMQSA